MIPSEEATPLDLTEVAVSTTMGSVSASLHAPIEVIGFHGCTEKAAISILSSNDFRLSTKAYDWVGDGFYFWEYASHRAEEWANKIYADTGDGSKPAVIRATIRLGNCLNLLDTEHMQQLADAYKAVVDSYHNAGRRLPSNTSTGAHFLDRVVVNSYCRRVEKITGAAIQTVRGCFPEGEPIYPESKILGKTHVQIAVRDAACITEVSII